MVMKLAAFQLKRKTDLYLYLLPMKLILEQISAVDGFQALIECILKTRSTFCIYQAQNEFSNWKFKRIHMLVGIGHLWGIWWYRCLARCARFCRCCSSSFCSSWSSPCWACSCSVVLSTSPMAHHQPISTAFLLPCSPSFRYGHSLFSTFILTAASIIDWRIQPKENQPTLIEIWKKRAIRSISFANKYQSNVKLGEK